MAEIVRDRAGRVKRWSSGEMALRWAAAEGRVPMQLYNFAPRRHDVAMGYAKGADASADVPAEDLASGQPDDGETRFRHVFARQDGTRIDYLAGTPLDDLIEAILGNGMDTHDALVARLDLAKEFIAHFVQASDGVSLRQALVYLSQLRPTSDSPPDTACGLAAEIGILEADIGGSIPSTEILTRSIDRLSSLSGSDAPLNIRSSALQALWFAYGKRGTLTASAEDYRRSAQSAMQVAELVGPNDPLHAEYALRASTSHLEQYELVKDPVALETAIEGFRRYLDHGSKRRKDRANANYLLGRSLRFRALSDKSLDQFEEAADHLECAVAEADFTNADICPYLSNLGFCYFERYQVSKETVDLDRALAALARSLAASEDVEEAPQRIANLANTLSLRIERAGYQFETLNLFALLEARLVETQRSETAADFFADMAWQAYCKAYGATRLDYYLFAIVMFERAAALIPDSAISLDRDSALADFAINGGAYSRLIADLSALKEGVRPLGIDVSGVDTYAKTLQLVIADIVADLRAAGMMPEQLAENDLRDVYDIALFVHQDTLAG